MIPPRKIGRTFLFRIPMGEDLYDAITEFCIEKRIRFGTVSGIGAVAGATIGSYDQTNKKYLKMTFKEELELTSCQGNVSLKEGKPFLHLHVTLCDVKCRAFGGHLFPGSRVFVGEVHITELKGKPLIRTLDKAAGLPLWTCGG